MDQNNVVPEVPVEEVAPETLEEALEGSDTTPEEVEEVAETPAEEVAEVPAEEVAETPEVVEEVTETPAEEVPTLKYAGQVVVSDGIRTVVGSGAEVHHLKLADGSEVDVSDEDYAAAVEASK